MDGDEGWSYEVEGSRLAFDGAISRVRVDRVRMPDGDVAEREVVEHPDAVAVVAVDDAERVVLLRHYRHALGTRILELPAGKLDVGGEEPAAAAGRELAEEAGLAAAELSELVRFANSGGWTDEHTTVYLGTGLTEVTAEDFTAAAEESDLEVLHVPLEDAVAMARRGEIDDAKTLIGLLLAHDILRQTSGGKTVGKTGADT